MMNREEALEYVSDYVWWPNVNDHAGKLQHVPTGWSWWNGDAGVALVHPTHDPITRADWQDARNGVVTSTPAAVPDMVNHPRITSPITASSVSTRSGRVTFVDILASGPAGQSTVDRAIVSALRKKEDLAQWSIEAWRRCMMGEG